MINNFEDLNLIDPILKSLKENGYSKPTPVQTESIPNIFNGKDILALAQTGTGKTGAFTIPILQDLQISKETSGYKGIQALILTPTRELATQVNSNIETYGKYTDLNATAVFGGIPRKVQIDYLSRDIDILTATPGRLLDLIDKGFVNLS